MTFPNEADQIIREEDWNALRKELDKTYNNFTNRLYQLYSWNGISYRYPNALNPTLTNHARYAATVFVHWSLAKVLFAHEAMNLYLHGL